jgi:hypothetical protein
MASTSYTDSTFAAAVIGARTDSAGSAATDTTAEEARLIASILNAGYIAPTGACQVAAQAVPNMTVKVGSGTAKVDTYVLAGTASGEGNYVVRLDVASQNVTVPAADASQTRTDEVYLVVLDNAYDSSARALPRIGYRTGTVGGANPGPDSSWKAYALLARITVAAAATTITSGNISDQRTASGLAGTLSTSALYTAKGDLLVASAASTPTKLAAGSNGTVHMADSTQTTGTKWAAVAAAGSASGPGSGETTNSGSYTDLPTPGPAVTVTIDPLGIAIVTVSADIACFSLNDGFASFAVSGANTIAANDQSAARLDLTLSSISAFDSIDIRCSAVTVLTGLTPGSTTFTMKYRSNFGTNSYFNRKIGVVAF